MELSERVKKQKLERERERMSTPKKRKLDQIDDRNKIYENNKRRKLWISPFDENIDGQFAIFSNCTFSRSLRYGAKWENFEEKKLIEYIKSNQFTLNEIAKKLGRTQTAVLKRLQIINDNDNHNKFNLNLTPIYKTRKGNKKKQMKIRMETTKLENKKKIKRKKREKDKINKMKIEIKTFNKTKNKISHLNELPKQKMSHKHVLDQLMIDKKEVFVINDENKNKDNKKSNQSNKKYYKPCRYFIKNNGSCRYGKNCKFNHNLSNF